MISLTGKDSGMFSNKLVGDIFFHGSQILPNADIDLKFNDIKKIQPVMVLPNEFIGIEVEVENLAEGFLSNKYKLWWTTDQDHSLRNNGLEFKTKLGIRNKHVPQIMDDLFSSISVNKDFSARTSIHVHINVMNLTDQQIFTMLLIYILAEQLLYQVAGQKRWKNIYCVPITNTDYFFNLLKYPLTDLCRSWTKYCGINLSTVRTFGTIEFRQLRGTDDIKLITLWVNLINLIKEYALEHTFEETKRAIFALNTNSNYAFFIANVFKGFTVFLPELHIPTIEENIYLLKTAFSQDSEISKSLTKIISKEVEALSDVPKEPQIYVPSLSSFKEAFDGSTIWLDRIKFTIISATKQYYVYPLGDLNINPDWDFEGYTHTRIPKEIMDYMITGNMQSYYIEY